MADPDPILTVSVWRGSDSGSFETFSVPRRPSQTVLDVVSWIQRNEAPDLAYRFACRVGMCGSCAMTVNGRPRWTCRTHVAKVAEDNRLEIAPLRNLPAIKDLVCDLAEFFEKWGKAEARFEPTKSRHDDIEPVLPESRERQAADAAIECINCAVCYAACDAVTGNQAYLGPAALNRAWTLMNDARDGNADGRLKAVSGPGGCQNCHSQQGCAAHCPNSLNPTASIAGLKRVTSLAILKGRL